LLCTVQAPAACAADVCAAGLTLEEVVPPSLAAYLADAGVDVTAPRAAIADDGAVKLFAYDKGSPFEYLVLHKDPDGTGRLVLIGNLLPGEEQGLSIAFDTAGDLFTAQQLTVECIRQISITFQSLVSVTYNCLAVPNALSCALNVIDLITNIILIPLSCEAPAEGTL
jgi:hypothetical protein